MRKWTDERYRIPGTNMFNFTKWSRENVPKSPPKYKVGDIVKVTSTQEIIRIGSDCDGTVLYELTNLGNGWSEDSIVEVVHGRK